MHLSVDGERTLCGLDLRTMYERSDMSDAAALALPRAWEAGNRCRRCVDSGLRGGQLDG